MTKRILAAMLGLAIACGLISCSSSDSGEGSVSEETKETENEEAAGDDGGGLFSFLNPDEETGNGYIYLSNNSYMYLSDLEEGTAIEIDTADVSSLSSSLVEFTSDNQYAYYFTEVESSVGTLHRAELGKLQQDSEQNGDYIQDVASEIRLYITGTTLSDFMQNDGSFTCLTDDGDIYYFDGDETMLIAEDIYGYYSDGENRLIYWYDDDEGYTIYGVELSNSLDQIELATNCYEMYGDSLNYDLDHIVYSAVDTDEYRDTDYYYYDGLAYDEETDEEILLSYYVVGFDGETEKLENAVGVYNYYYYDGSFYYTAKTERQLP